MNKNKIDQMKDALDTKFIEVDGVAIYMPDGQVEGIVTFEFKKWTGHAKIDYFQVSIKYKDARSLQAQLESKLGRLDTDLYIMKADM